MDSWSVNWIDWKFIRHRSYDYSAQNMLRVLRQQPYILPALDREGQLSRILASLHISRFSLATGSYGTVLTQFFARSHPITYIFDPLHRSHSFFPFPWTDNLDGQGVCDHAGWNRLSRLEACEKDEGRFGGFFCSGLGHDTVVSDTKESRPVLEINMFDYHTMMLLLVSWSPNVLSPTVCVSYAIYYHSLLSTPYDNLVFYSQFAPNHGPLISTGTRSLNYSISVEESQHCTVVQHYTALYKDCYKCELVEHRTTAFPRNPLPTTQNAVSTFFSILKLLVFADGCSDSRSR